MKAITISVDDETYRYYQRNAEAVGASVEEWVGARLANLLPNPLSEADQEDIRQQTNDLLARIDARRKAEGKDFQPGEKLTRDELHDRNALR